MAVVVTGLGCVSPFGIGAKENFDAIFAGKCCLSSVDFGDDVYAKVAGEIKFADQLNEKWRKMAPAARFSKFMLYGLEATSEALLDARLIESVDKKVEQNLRIGVVVGSGIGGIEDIDACSRLMIEKNARRVSPFFLPVSLINLLAGHIAIQYGITGVNFAPVAACATGGFAIADAARLIEEGYCDVVIAGASEGAVCKISAAGFCSLRALSDESDPSIASKPFDQNRSGFVLSEGAGIMILENETHAKNRGAKIYCKMLSSGMTCDAYNIVAPEETGSGAAAAMEMALRRANIPASEIDYINAHATSTPLGDAIELNAINSVFGDQKIMISSIKGATGHMLGAAGAYEAVMIALSLASEKILPTINLTNLDPVASYNGTPRDLVPIAKQKAIKYALSNSFGFGGQNVSLLFGLS